MSLKRPHDFKIVSDGERKRAYRLRAEQALGRKLSRTEVIHHHTEDQLVICQNQTYHLFLHGRMNVVRAGGNPNTDRVCSHCRQVKPLASFGTRGPKLPRSHICRPCNNAYSLARYYQRQNREALCRS